MPVPQGVGSFGSGAGPAGGAPLGSSAPTTADPPSALLFDPATRDFRLGPDGLFVTVHPVDQEAALALWIRQGSIGSAPGAGNQIRNLARQGGPGFIGKVQDIIRLALKRLLDRNAIRIIDVAVTTPARGQTFILVTYVNLMLQAPQTPVKVPVLV